MKVTLLFDIVLYILLFNCFGNGYGYSRVDNGTVSHRRRQLTKLADYSQVGHIYDQKLTVYFSNPRAASLFMTDRILTYGSGRYQFFPKIEEGSEKAPSARWMLK